MPSAADWDLFEPSFRAAAEAEFSDGQLRWVSMDEYEKVPSRA